MKLIYLNLHNQNNKWNYELSSETHRLDRRIYITVQVLKLGDIGPFYNYLLNMIYIVPFGIFLIKKGLGYI